MTEQLNDNNILEQHLSYLLALQCELFSVLYSFYVEEQSVESQLRLVTWPQSVTLPGG